MDYDVESDMIARIYGERFRKDAKRDMKYVDFFCQQKGVELIRVTTLNENGFPQLAYEFTDNLGLYTLEGLEASLAKEND